jgi:hypothetical protein
MRKILNIIAVICLSSSIALASLLLSFGNNSAFAHGDNPSTCNNLYNSTIKSMKITTNRFQTVDPIAHPNTVFASKIGQGYTVTLTIHSASTSIAGNTNPGSVWYGTDALGFHFNFCVNGASPNSDITITSGGDRQVPIGTKELYHWYTWFTVPRTTVTYTVIWY